MLCIKKNIYIQRLKYQIRTNSNLIRLFQKLIPGKQSEYQDSNDYRYIRSKSTRTPEDYWTTFMKREKYAFIIACLYHLYVIHSLYLVITYIRSIQNLQGTGLPENILPFILWALIPVLVWIWSTAFNDWNYHNKKLQLLTIVITQAALIISGYVLSWSHTSVLSLILRIPINRNISKRMVINLARLILIAAITPVWLLTIHFFNILNDDHYKPGILRFRISHYLDLRKNKEWKYDLRIVYDIKSGKPHIIKESDRLLHTMADGTTGTGKTSSALTPAIVSDMDQKVKNTQKQMMECLEEVKKGAFQIIRPFSPAEFSINYFKPVILPGSENRKENDRRVRKYHHLKFDIQSAGINVMSPTGTWADELYELAHARGIKVNHIDPIMIGENLNEHKPDFVGFNPLYISPLLTKNEWEQEVTDKAVMLSDILQSIYDSSGSGDPYFQALNKSITIAVTRLLLATFPALNNRQPSIVDLQVVMHDFPTLKPYLEHLLIMYQNDINISVSADAYDKVAAEYKKNVQSYGIKGWESTYLIIKYELLTNNEKLVEHARGLRTQIDSLTQNKLITDVYCAEKVIDFDQALANGEVTIFNYAIELGESVSRTFGLFYLLSFAKAIARRPGTESTRILCFNYIDELPKLIHSQFEQFLVFFRQFRVASFFALQSLDQMDRTESTRYLKGILLSNTAHQLYYGRMSPTEMELVEKICGKIWKAQIQESLNWSSLANDTPNMTHSKRQSYDYVSRIQGTDARYREFQEITFLTVNDNTPLPPMVARVKFLPDYMRKGVPVLQIPWYRYFPDDIKTAYLEMLTGKEKKLCASVTDKITIHRSSSPETIPKKYRFGSGSVPHEQEIP